MNHPRHLRIKDYLYDLPQDRIATHPLPERDASRLLVYKDGIIAEDIFRSLTDHLPSNTLLLLNQTKVVPARLLFRKATGGVVEVFCLEPDARYAGVATALAQKERVFWRCLVGGASKWKHGMVLEQKHGDLTLHAAIAAREEGSFVIELFWENADLTFAEVLQKAGAVPLPPYIHRDAEENDKTRYQAVFAREEGSVAAPTASLHFTPDVLDKLQEKGASLAFATLHVGAGTFKPVKSEVMEGHDMHAEWMEVDAAFVSALLSDKHLVVPVGTTALRTVESLYWIGRKLVLGEAVDFSRVAVSQWEPYELESTVPVKAALEAVLAHIEAHGGKLVTRTQILIAPGYEWKIANGLITNFHQPESTLLLLVAAFVGEDWRKVYDYALESGFRFLSYGDGSLLWRNQ